MAGISITLAGNFAKLDELKDKAGKTAKGIKSAFSSDLGQKALGTFGAVATGVFAAIVASVKETIDAGGDLQDMMTKTAARGKELMILEQAFKNAGLSSNDVTGSIFKLQKALAGVNEEGEPTNTAFEKLGLNIEDLVALDPAQAVAKVGEALGSIEDPAQRSATAMRIFGKSGGNLMAVFNDSEAFAQAETQLGSLADILPAMAGDLDGVGDALGSCDVKVKQLGAGVTQELMPELKDLAQWMNETDFVAIGQGIGIVAGKLTEWGTALAEISQYLPGMIIMNKLADMGFGGDADPEKARKMAEEIAAADPDYMKPKQQRDDEQAAMKDEKNRKFQEGVAADMAIKAAAKKKKDDEQAAKEADKKADAAKKEAAEREKSRRLAIEEYNLDSAILNARLAGDKKRLEAAEREKAIRMEIRRLEGAGFTAAEASKPAEAKVDADKRATDLEEKRKKQAEKKKEEIGTIQDRIKDLREKHKDLQFQSTIGKVSDMQRVGGGGGAVGSGLDYQRQSSDLLRAIDAKMLELIRVSGSNKLDV
jgi:hypothetical protein